MNPFPPSEFEGGDADREEEGEGEAGEEEIGGAINLEMAHPLGSRVARRLAAGSGDVVLDFPTMRRSRLLQSRRLGSGIAFFRVVYVGKRSWREGLL